VTPDPRDLAAREADRLRHGVPIEGDFVCPDALRADSAERERDDMRATIDALKQQMARGFEEREGTINRLLADMRSVYDAIGAAAYPGQATAPTVPDAAIEDVIELRASLDQVTRERDAALARADRAETERAESAEKHDAVLQFAVETIGSGMCPTHLEEAKRMDFPAFCERVHSACPWCALSRAEAAEQSEAELVSAGQAMGGAVVMSIGQMASMRKERDASLAHVKNVESTLRSIATMLGWENVPPRESLEANIRANRARLQSAEHDRDEARSRIDALRARCAKDGWCPYCASAVDDDPEDDGHKDDCLLAAPESGEHG
jgi:hypothetical protein